MQRRDFFVDCVNDSQCTKPLTCGRRSNKCVLQNPLNPLRDIYVDQFGDHPDVVEDAFQDLKLEPGQEPWIATSPNQSDAFYQIKVDREGVNAQRYSLSDIGPQNQPQIYQWIANRASLNPHNQNVLNSITTNAPPAPTITRSAQFEQEQERARLLEQRLQQEQELEEHEQFVHDLISQGIVSAEEAENLPADVLEQKIEAERQRQAREAKEQEQALEEESMRRMRGRRRLRRIESPISTPPSSPPPSPPRQKRAVGQEEAPIAAAAVQSKMLSVNEALDDFILFLNSLPPEDVNFVTVYNLLMDSLRNVVPIAGQSPPYPDYVNYILEAITNTFAVPNVEPPWARLKDIVLRLHQIGIQVPPNYQFRWFERLKTSRAWGDVRNIALALAREDYAAANQIIRQYQNPQNHENAILLSDLASMLIRTNKFPPATNQVLEKFIVQSLRG